MVLFVIGLGLGDERDITVRGMEAIKQCARVYLEHYTSILGVDRERLEKFYEKKVVLADRDMVETGCQEIMEGAKDEDVAFLVVGDPFGATTHTDFVLRAKEQGIPVQVIHNASIMNAIGCCGLQLYRFGETISLVFFTDTWRPDSFYSKVKSNGAAGLHTLCLLDIKVKEPTMESLARGKPVYLPPRYMTINQAVAQLLEIEEKLDQKAYSKDTICIGVARVGQADQLVVQGRMEDLLTVEFGAPLHSLVICGDVHEFEQESIDILAEKATEVK
eukprot:TRINITY_DN6657_c0_g1_i1.p1 TRINITY_DN6657_c0_g1~~TRINITY_DN6657_c0_g1_i1.p1  ORF type:complete len:275 (+),score=54.10 TRINITY_DN6657_c0_g1_i1:132-956(+)